VAFAFCYLLGFELTPRLGDRETSVLALHLLQASLIYVNTLMVQQVLEEPDWLERMLPEDLRAHLTADLPSRQSLRHL
jgi:TnpA family transposase